MTDKRMKTRTRRLAALGLSLTLALSSLSPALAEEPVVTATPEPEEYHSAYYAEEAETDKIPGWVTGPQIEAQAAVVIDLNDGGIIYSKNGDTQLYPASITKVLTALLALQNLNLKDEHAMTEAEAFGIEAGSSSIYAGTDEVFTVEQELMALMLESANEIALALADQTSGSVKKFTELMNRTARRLGCTGSHFNNPHGLPDPTHYTTANDMAKIALACWNNPSFRNFATTGLYQIPPTNVQPETRYLLNHHKMMKTRDYEYEGVLGGKTGYTDLAGNTLITYAQRGNILVACVVLNSVGGAYADTKALLDYTFDNFKRVNVKPFEKDRRYTEILPCDKFLRQDANPFYLTYPAYVTVPKDFDLSKIERVVTPVNNEWGAPSFWNEFFYEGHKVGSVRLYEKENALAGILK